MIIKNTRTSAEKAIDQTSPLSPNGRFGRLSYIAWGSILVFAGILLIETAGAASDLVAAPVGVFVGVTFLILGTIFAIRRCRDAEVSGWWSTLLFVPVINIVFVIFLFLKAGSEGINRFGPVRATPAWEKVVGYIGIVFGFPVLLGLLVGLLGPHVMMTLASSKTKTARIQILEITGQLDLYRLVVGRYPTTAEGLQALVHDPGNATSWNGPYLKAPQGLKDPWGFDYEYRSPGEHGSFDIWSLGADNREGGDGEDQDVHGWE